MKTWAKSLAAALLGLALLPAWGAVEDGYDLWLRYRALPPAGQARVLAQARGIVFAEPASPTLQAAVAELRRGVAGLSGREPVLPARPVGGALMLVTPANVPAGVELPWDQLGREGYALRSLKLQGRPVTLIAANTDLGLLYGSFAWLRAASTAADLAALNQRSSPKLGLRLLNHWDNLDRTVERGYAGASIWDWWKLPDIRDARYVDYARANASLGINGTVLNNVNAKADSLTAPFLAKAAALADVFRPYGIKVYLSARFSAPVDLGGLKTADPLDPAVRAWWKAKADEIYRLIPDFGGYLVKANSEGQPGPQDYGRNHADGANMLAEALAPHGGIVMWRAFVYAPDTSDRAKQAFNEFQPLDGKFASNVIVQVKNGAIDFQPREPFHPLFGAMPKTPLALELQITKEYLGFATHLVYLGPAVRGGAARQARRRDGGSACQGHRRRRQHRQRPQLERLALRPGQLVRLRPRGLGPGPCLGRHRARMGAADLHDRTARRRHHRVDDDRFARGCRRLHDAAGPAPPDGHGSSPWPGAVGRQPGARRLEPGLLPPRRPRRHRLRPQPHGQQRRGAVRARGGGAICQPGDDAREPAAVVPSPALGSPHGIPPHAVGRTRRAL